MLFSTNGTAQLGLATFQELNSHAELVATVLDKVGRIRSPLCIRGALGSLLKLIGPRFLHLQNGDNNNTSTELVWGVSKKDVPG